MLLKMWGICISRFPPFSFSVLIAHVITPIPAVLPPPCRDTVQQFVISLFTNIIIYLYNQVCIINGSLDILKERSEAAMTTVEDMSESLKLLSDKSRLTILALLREQEMCVCDLVEILETTQPNVSQHLKKLRMGGLINETKRRQWVYYSLNLEDKPYLNELIAQLPSMKERITALSSQSCD